MLPELLKNDTWRKLQEFMITNLQASKEYYHALGIDLCLNPKESEQLIQV
jgi:hypothetical protein